MNKKELQICCHKKQKNIEEMQFIYRNKNAKVSCFQYSDFGFKWKRKFMNREELMKSVINYIRERVIS